MKDWGKQNYLPTYRKPRAGWYRSTHCTFYFAAITKVFISTGICSKIPLISNESIPTAEATVRGRLMKVKGKRSGNPDFSQMFILPIEGGGPYRLCDFGQITQALGVWVFSSIKMNIAGHLGGLVSWASDFGSGHDLTVREFKPCIGLCADSSEPRVCFGSVSPSLCAPPPHTLCLSLPLKNKEN